MTAAFPSPCCKANSRFLRIEAGSMQFSCLACGSAWVHGAAAAPRSTKARVAPPRHHRVVRTPRKPARTTAT